MTLEDQLAELRHLATDAREVTEAGVAYVFLPGLRLPDGCNPPIADCLLALGARDGYDNRLFFATMVTSPQSRNWNSQNIRILERNWCAFSWRVPSGLRPIETLIGHLQALR